MKKFLSYVIIVAALLFGFGIASYSAPVSAACVATDVNGKCIQNNPDPAANPNAKCTKDDCPLLTKYLNPFIAFLSAMVGVVVTAAIIYGSIEISSSGGDPQRNASGRKHITNAVFALLAFLFLFAFLQWLVPGGIV